MPKKPNAKMSIEDRAKQFAPFSALKGLDEALKETEWKEDAKLQARHRIIKEK